VIDEDHWMSPKERFEEDRDNCVEILFKGLEDIFKSTKLSKGQ